jgi:hypothetical protein
MLFTVGFETSPPDIQIPFGQLFTLLGVAGCGCGKTVTGSAPCVGLVLSDFFVTGRLRSDVAGGNVAGGFAGGPARAGTVGTSGAIDARGTGGLSFLRRYATCSSLRRKKCFPPIAMIPKAPSAMDPQINQNAFGLRLPKSLWNDFSRLAIGLLVNAMTRYRRTTAMPSAGRSHPL